MLSPREEFDIESTVMKGTTDRLDRFIARAIDEIERQYTSVMCLLAGQHGREGSSEEIYPAVLFFLDKGCVIVS